MAEAVAEAEEAVEAVEAEGDARNALQKPATATADGWQLYFDFFLRCRSKRN